MLKSHLKPNKLFNEGSNTSLCKTVIVTVVLSTFLTAELARANVLCENYFSSKTASFSYNSQPIAPTLASTQINPYRAQTVAQGAQPQLSRPDSQISNAVSQLEISRPNSITPVTAKSVLEGLNILKRIESSFVPYTSALETLSQLSEEKVQLTAKLQKLEIEFSKLNKKVEKDAKINNLPIIESAFAEYKSISDRIREVKKQYDFLTDQGNHYLQAQFQIDYGSLTSLSLTLANLREGKPAAAMVQSKMALMQNLGKLDTYLSQAQMNLESLYSTYSVMEVQKVLLLLELRKYTSQFKAFEEDSILELDNQIGPSQFAANGTEKLRLDFEIGVRETMFGFKPVFLPKGNKVRSKNIASMNPNISIMGVSRGTFFKVGGKLIAVVGFFPDSTVLVDVINPKTKKSKLKRMKISDLKGHEEIPTSGIYRPVIYGDAYYLNGKNYALSKEAALNKMEIELEKIGNIIIHDEGSSVRFYVYLFAGASLVFYYLLGESNPLTHIFSFTSVFAFLMSYILNFKNRAILKLKQGKLSSYNDLKKLEKIIGKPFEFADGSHHSVNNYDQLMRSPDVSLDLAELKEEERQELLLNYSNGNNDYGTQNYLPLQNDQSDFSNIEMKPKSKTAIPRVMPSGEYQD